MITKVLHTGISVYNMEESIKWYKEVLGFELVKDDGFVPPLHARVCFLQLDDYQIELFEYENPIALPEERKTPDTDLQTVGTKHVAFAVDDMEQMKAHLLLHNVDIAHEVRMNGDYVMFIRDCNGVLIELIQQ